MARGLTDEQLRAALARAGAEKYGPASDIVERLAADLLDARAQLAALRDAFAHLQTEYEDAHDAATELLDARKALAELQREYEGAWAAARAMEAKMGESFQVSREEAAELLDLCPYAPHEVPFMLRGRLRAFVERSEGERDIIRSE